MHKVSGIILSILALYLFSCSEKNQFPEKKSEKLPLSAVKVEQPLFKNLLPANDSLAKQSLSDELQQLKSFISKYENRDSDFSLETIELLWLSEMNKLDLVGLESVSAWIETTGFLLEITGKPVYAEALQKLGYEEKINLSAPETKLAEEKLAPYIFTKNVDHIFVNLFVNSSVEYDHSLGGKIKITQELTGSKSLLLKFSTTEKRYIEVHILIPAEAQNATVTEKNVKYVATPGEYCLIARKWKEGDVVEVKY
jgi:hypothetical protein